MRVLFLNPGGSLGGAERCLLDLVASLRADAAAGPLAIGLVAGGEGPLAAAAEALGARVFTLPLSKRLAAVGDSALVREGGVTPRGGAPAVAAFVRRLAGGSLEAPLYAARLRRVVREFAPTIVHSNGIKMHVLAAVIGVGAPLVWHVRDFIGARPLVSGVMGALAPRAAVAVAISNAVAEDARLVLPKLPVAVVHDAIDTHAFSPAGPTADLDALAASEPAPPGTLRVGLVATYARWKGHEVFLRAAQALEARRAREKVPAARYYVIGGPIYDTAASQFGEDELRTMAAGLEVSGAVRFVPFQRDVEKVFRALDVVVHASSRPEPFGRTIAEAMATGKPVVASRESGAAELFADGVDAIASPARDPGALADAIGGLLAAPNRREAIGRAARATAVRRFSRERLAQQVLGVYRNCC